MSTSLRVAIADDDRVQLERIASFLRDLGHEVVAAVGAGHDLIAACEQHAPNLVIADIVLPDMLGLEAISAIQDIRPTPIIVISAYDDPEYIQRAKSGNVMAYLVKPVTQENLGTNIELALYRFEELHALREEASALQERLAARKLIERAKGILMHRTGLTESEAHRRLQQLASTKNRKLVEIAAAIIDADDALGPPQ
ncbi:MAG: response regulator [Planctomycetaceae bacterium]|nr:response regulator [Planctomycetaceae bacterium]